jgi:hypothetical protein
MPRSAPPRAVAQQTAFGRSVAAVPARKLWKFEWELVASRTEAGGLVAVIRRLRRTRAQPIETVATQATGPAAGLGHMEAFHALLT